jgi:hypothetical protein
MRSNERAEGQVVQVRERQLVACEVPLLREDLLVHGHLGGERLLACVGARRLLRAPHNRQENALAQDRVNVAVEARAFNRERLLETRSLLDVAVCDEGRVCLGCNVLGDSG